MPTPRADGYDAIVRALFVTLWPTPTAPSASPASVGIGTPGSLAPGTGHVFGTQTRSASTERPSIKDLAEAIGRPVRIANDANCFALSEAIDGAGAGARVVFGVIVGTGTGGGVVVDEQIHVGPNAVAGEWGHTPLPWAKESELPGPECYCGRRGCVETWLSGPALAADYHRATGERLAAAEIDARSKSGDSDALAALERHADRFARSLAVVIDLLDPDVVVLGGGVSNIMSLYDAVPKRLSRYVFGDAERTRVVRAKHGDSSGVRGAAWLWPRSKGG